MTFIMGKSFAGCNEAPFTYPRLVQDDSFKSLSHASKTKYLKDFYNDFCKLPPVIRNFLNLRDLEIYITSGPITLNSYLAETASGVRPRNHRGGTYDDLPGVSANDGKLVVLNLTSLHEGHGAKSLILHEVAHSLDYLFGDKKASKKREFKRVIKQTPWERFYQENRLLDPSTDIPKEFTSEEAIEDYKRYIEETNAGIIANTEERIRYHKKNKEEHFAEIIGMWYLGGEHREKVESTIPLVVNYMKHLESEISKKEIHIKMLIEQERLLLIEPI